MYWEALDDHNFDLAKLRNEVLDGPWQRERDRVEFRHSGLECLIQRQHRLAWCGYVGLPRGHKYYGLDYQELYEIDKNIPSHGGLTYAKKCIGFICHKAKVVDDDVWWLGFDCCHASDLVPGLYCRKDNYQQYDYLMRTTVYRTEKYVIDTVKEMASYLASV